jgi:hypothetical protein
MIKMIKMIKWMKMTMLWASIGLLPALVGGSPAAADGSTAESVNRAVAVLHPTANNQVSGVVSFTRIGEEVQISATVK